MADPEPEPNKSRKRALLDWFGSPSFFIYANYLCSQWGDWMWLFASGLYLVHLDDGMLRLAAGFGFAGGGCVLLFGGLIGEWVDRNHRLYVVRVALFVQNSCVMLSALSVGSALYLEEYAPHLWQGPLQKALEGTIITFAILAQLASIGYKISIEKDWIVVVAKGNKSVLANLNAVTRAIDLTAKILAPTCVGLVMSYASLLVSAIVIASWNVVSVFLEYAMLMKVYGLVPELANKTLRTAPSGEEEGREMKDMKSAEPGETEPMNRPQSEADRDEKEATPTELVQNGPTDADAEKQPLKPDAEAPISNAKQKEAEAEAEKGRENKKKKSKSTCRGCLGTMFGPIVVLIQGWRTYARQKVVFASLGLATLYMTVMGFDSVTTGYIYSTGASEWVVGLSMALAGVTGIASTFIFTRLRRRIGLERTGLIAFNAEIICLTLAVASVWAPGSPFDPHFYSRTDNCSAARANVTSERIQAGVFRMEDDFATGVQRSGGGNESQLRTRRSAFGVDHLGELGMAMGQVSLVRDGWIDRSGWSSEGHALRVRRETWDEALAEEPQYSVVHPGEEEGPRGVSADVHVRCAPSKKGGVNVSIILFLIGIITSRTGLWMADLVVTQLLQENVIETERGVVNGVQNSLNMLMEMTKFILVIIIPHIETFGILIIVSFIFICIAAMFFATHSYRVRGHLFHFEKCLCYNNNFVVEGAATHRGGGGGGGGTGTGRDAEECREPACGQHGQVSAPAPVEV